MICVTVLSNALYLWISRLGSYLCAKPIFLVISFPPIAIDNQSSDYGSIITFLYS